MNKAKRCVSRGGGNVLKDSWMGIRSVFGKDTVIIMRRHPVVARLAAAVGYLVVVWVTAHAEQIDQRTVVAILVRHHRVEQKFTKGRKNMNVIAVCLYVACRQKDTRKYMLIDFSDLLQVRIQISVYLRSLSNTPTR